MPLKKCSSRGKDGWKWGEQGKCFTGPKAKEKAARQGRAIKSSEGGESMGAEIILEESMFDLKQSEDKKSSQVNFLIDLNQEVTLDEEGVGKGYQVLYFKGKAQKFSHWMGEFELNSKIFQDFMINNKKNALGRDLFVNYNHERTVAAGWYVDLYLADKEGKKLSDMQLTTTALKEGIANRLLADIKWTPNAQKALRDQEYRYFSSEFVLGQYKNSETGKVYENVYTGGALTNNPFLRKTNVELEDSENKEETMNKKEMILSLKDEHDMDVEQLLADSKKLVTVENLLTAANVKVEVLTKDLKAIEDAQVKKDVESLLGDMVREGKSNKHLNDTVCRPLFLSIGIEEAKKKAASMAVIIKFEAKGTEQNEVQDGVSLNESQKLEKAANALVAKAKSEGKELSFEEAVDSITLGS